MKHSPAVGHAEVTQEYSVESKFLFFFFFFLIELKVL